MTTFKRALFFCIGILPIFWLLALTGCGGGGGDSVGTMSPEELEVATAIDAFAAAINEEDTIKALTYVDSNLQYYGGSTNTQILKYGNFQTRLNNFFVLADSVKFEISSLGITFGSETIASARGQMFLDYTSGGIDKKVYESVEIKLEKTSKTWGILEFAQYGTSGITATQFPPIN